MTTSTRRTFLRSTAIALASGALAPSLVHAQGASSRPRRILLRNAWQNVNIGDIGHYLGALELIERYFPEAEVTLWPSRRALEGVREKLLYAYPKLKISEGQVKEGKPTTPELSAAWTSADFLLHGSGNGFGARADLSAWHRVTGKPYGVFGTSMDPISGIGIDRDPEGGTLASLWERSSKLPANYLDNETRGIIEKASFMFCRDTLTRDYLKAQGVKAPILEFGPDTQFGMKKRDDAAAIEFCRQHGLEERKFICAIPRLRYTPNYRIHNNPRTPADDIRDAINNRTTESDHAKVRDLIIAYIRNTGNKVLVCAECTYQVPMGKEVLVDPLPADVKRNVVWRDNFWFTYEAAAVYARSQAVVCVDCHSPIIALAHGVPGFYVRQPTDTCKGQMFHDVGVTQWVFESDLTSGREMWSRLDDVCRQPAKASARVRTAMEEADRLQKRMVDVLRSAASA